MFQFLFLFFFFSLLSSSARAASADDWRSRSIYQVRRDATRCERAKLRPKAGCDGQVCVERQLLVRGM